MHDSRTFINFANGSYQWVDIQRFRQTDDLGPSDPALLAAMIGHDAFGDDYATWPGDNPERHGPYWRDRISPTCYDLVDAEAAEQELRAWAQQLVTVADEILLQLEQEVYEPLRAADVVYRLRDLGPQAFHDWGGVHNEFP